MKLNQQQRAEVRKYLGCPSVMSFHRKWRAMSDEQQNATLRQVFP